MQRILFILILPLILLTSCNDSRSTTEKERVLVQEEIKEYLIEHYQIISDLYTSKTKVPNTFALDKSKEIALVREKVKTSEESLILRNINGAYGSYMYYKLAIENSNLEDAEQEERLFFEAMDNLYEYLITFCDYDGEKLIRNSVIDSPEHESVEYESYYFADDITAIKYKGLFVFHDIIRVEVAINEEILLSDENGRFIKLSLDEIDGVPDERLLIGYFYEENEVIYRITATDENINQLLEKGKLPEDSIIVCQTESLDDTLSDKEAGFHHYIDVENDEIIYHSFNNLTETGYYETFVWEIGVGLIQYKSGFGAERESIKLEIVNEH